MKCFCICFGDYFNKHYYLDIYADNFKILDGDRELLLYFYLNNTKIFCCDLKDVFDISIFNKEDMSFQVVYHKEVD